MNRDAKKSASLIVLVAAVGALATRNLYAEDGKASLHVEGDAAAVQLDVNKTSLNDVLNALSDSFEVSYSSKVALTEQRDGTYQGSLRQVIARVLVGYDYAIRQEHAKLDVTVFEKVGGQAVPAPQQHSVVAHRAALKRAAQ